MQRGIIKRLGSRAVDVQLAGSASTLTNLQLADHIDPSVLTVGTPVLVDVVDGQHVVAITMGATTPRTPVQITGTASAQGVNNALLADGSVPLTGNLPVAPGVLIDGYDISVLGQAIDNLQAADSVARTGHTVLTHASHLVATIGPDDTEVLIRHGIFADKETLVVSNTNGEVEMMRVVGAPVATVDDRGALCYRYTVSRRTSTNPPGIVTGWAAATLVNGLTRRGWISVDARENSPAAPNLRFVMHTNIDAGTTEQIVRIGNLRGILGNDETDFGFATGRLNTGDRYFAYNYARNRLALRGADIAVSNDAGVDIFRVWANAEDGHESGDARLGHPSGGNIQTRGRDVDLYAGGQRVMSLTPFGTRFRNMIWSGTQPGPGVGIGEESGQGLIAARNPAGIGQFVVRTGDINVHIHMGNPIELGGYAQFANGEFTTDGIIRARAFELLGGGTIGSGVVLTNAGKFTAGTGNNVAVIDGEDTTWRIYAGHATPASAPFRVSQAGALTATNATITGTVTANAGSIGGWAINNNYLGATNVGLAPADYPFYAGSSYANRATAPFRVTPAGALTATSGVVGGWTLGSSSLTGGNATLHNNGYLSLGTSNDIARLDAADATFRLWIGNAVSGMAPFRVTKGGALFASDATITGAINATEGSIGGWTIPDQNLYGSQMWAGEGNERAGMIPGYYPFYAGSEFPDEAPFSVTSEGIITATSGAIAGWIMSEGHMYFGSFANRTGMYPGAGYPFYAGSETPAAAPFRVTQSGALTATSGAVGGWTLGSSSLTGGNATLHNTGYLSLGTGNDIARLDAANATFRLWIGNAAPNVAPFRVTKAGALFATNATITGAINATAGTILGSLLVGSVDPRIHIDGNNRRIESTNFASGTSGFRISGDDGSAEFNNVTVRGALAASVIQYGYVQATNGSIWVTKAAGRSLYEYSPSPDVGDISTISIENPDGMSHAAAGSLWVVGDVVRLKEPLAGDFWGIILEVLDLETHWNLRIETTQGVNPKDKESGDGTGTVGGGGIGGGGIGGGGIGGGVGTVIPSLTGVFPAGATVLNYGQPGDGVVRITADADNNPYISIATHAGSPWSSLDERARLGNLAGISGASGYGLWTDNGYFIGTVTANEGVIGGWTLTKDDLYAGSGSNRAGMQPLLYPFYAGNETPAAAPFRVSSNGSLVATNATIAGTVNAGSGLIGGWTLSSSGLTGGNATLHSSGYLSLGIGNDVARLDAANSIFRLWIGHASASLAPFRVTKAGALIASNADITGTINANGGSIAGWTIASGHLYAGAGKDRAGMLPGEFPFYAGLEDAETAPFRVSSSGELTATDANITGIVNASAGNIAGWTIAATKLFWEDPANFRGIGMATYNDASGWAFWAGDHRPAYAEFRVSNNGAMWATAGNIAGWTITSGHLYSGTGANRTGLQPASYPFYAGSETPAAAPFRVTQAGALTASNVNITAGGGNVTLDSNGLRLAYANTGTAFVSWYSGSTLRGYIGSFVDGGTNVMRINVQGGRLEVNGTNDVVLGGTTQVGNFRNNGGLAFFSTSGIGESKQTVTGSRGGNAALASLLTALAAYGLITNSTTA